MIKYGYLSSDLAKNGSLINNMSKGEFNGRMVFVFHKLLNLFGIENLRDIEN